MPEICRFLGIVIFMLYDDHAPAHFHAEYGEYKISVDIESGVVNGRFPPRALRAVMEWHGLNKENLLEDWTLAKDHKALKKLPPLE
ncbi:MAG TPA: DUF4160 domain-containing protein [Tichowtungia sp.]|nr:DUF4160 domain-containing protein [Tichowtungia sp.]